MAKVLGNDWTFIGIKNGTSAKGDPYMLAVLDCNQSMERMEFFVGRDCKLDLLQRGDLIDITLDLTKAGYRTNVALVSCTKHALSKAI